MPDWGAISLTGPSSGAVMPTTLVRFVYSPTIRNAIKTAASVAAIQLQVGKESGGRRTALPRNWFPFAAGASLRKRSCTSDSLSELEMSTSRRVLHACRG